MPYGHDGTAAPRQLLSDGGDGSGLDELSHRSCPRCGSDSVIPIFNGRSTPAMEALAARRVIELAGQAFDPAQPRTRCRDCDHAWSRLAG